MHRYINFGPSSVFVVPPRLNIESCRFPLFGRVSFCRLSLSTWFLFATYVYVQWPMNGIPNNLGLRFPLYAA